MPGYNDKRELPQKRIHHQHGKRRNAQTNPPPASPLLQAFMSRYIFVITLFIYLFIVSWQNGRAVRRSTRAQLVTSAKEAAPYRNDTSLVCHSQGLPSYPPKDSIERRMSHALIVGSMKSGTSALSTYLNQHPHVAPTRQKELHFFDFRLKPERDGIYRRDARELLKKTFHNSLHDESRKLLYEYSNAVTIEDSPRYIFLSQDIPARILCVVPWVKILAVLRNPVDRAYSQYNMYKTFNPNSTETFDDWVARDFELLRETGVIQKEIPQNEFAGSIEEQLAWKRYTRGYEKWVVGRGLYALQLRHWFAAFRAAGKDESSFMIIQSEEMKRNKASVYKQVLEFLELEEFDLPTEEEPYSFKYNAPMKNETRELLQNFYRPYNKELYELLGTEWEGIWDSF